MANSNSIENQCPNCGSKAIAVAGLCPKCLLAAGIGNLSPNLETYSLRSSSRVSFEAPSVEDLAKEFPELEIIALAGRGGMGAVYKAIQMDLDRTVALKILPPEVAEEPSFAIRFSREARALAQLNHPNIVQVFRTGKSENYFYFLMEFVEGVNLRQAIRAGEISSEAALSIVPQICDALQYAHNEGIVHRDIKPENILLDKSGQVKVTDFGLAKVIEPGNDMTLTATQQIMGTAHYMAPEQVHETRAVDHRADIYSLGVVFYELLTGQLPIGRFAVPSDSHGTDPRLDKVVLKTLENEPDRRYQAAVEVKTDINSVNNSPAIASQQLVNPQVVSSNQENVAFATPSAPIKSKSVYSEDSSLSQTIANWIGFAFLGLAVWRICILGYFFYQANQVMRLGLPYSMTLNSVFFFDIVTIIVFLIGGTQLLRRKGYQLIVFSCLLAISRLIVVFATTYEWPWEVSAIVVGVVSLALIATPPIRNLFGRTVTDALTNDHESLERRSLAKLGPPGLVLEILGYLGVGVICFATLLGVVLFSWRSIQANFATQAIQTGFDLGSLNAMQGVTTNGPQVQTQVDGFFVMALLWFIYLSLAILMIVAGRKIRNAKWYVFCIVVSVLLLIPVGPALWIAANFMMQSKETLASWLLLAGALPALVKIVMGLWCLAVLLQNEVRRTFANRSLNNASVKGIA